MKRFLVLMLISGLLVSLCCPAQADEEKKEAAGEQQGAVEKGQEVKKEAEQIRGKRGTGERRNYPMRPGMGREMPPGMDMEGRQVREMPRMGFEQRIDSMNRQIEQRKSEHNNSMQELKAILEVVGTLNHEINNPLTVVLGRTELLCRKVDNFDPQTFDSLKNIKKEAEKIRDVVMKLTKIIEPVSREYLNGLNIIDMENSTSHEKEGNKPTI